MGALGLIFLGVVGFSIYRSRGRVKTLLYVLVAMALSGVVGVLLAVLSAGRASAGAVGLPLVCGMLTAMVHSRKSRDAMERKVGKWIRSLDYAQLLDLMLKPDTGLDKQDCDGIVQLMHESYPDGQRDVIVGRIAEHLARQGVKIKDIEAWHWWGEGARK